MVRGVGARWKGWQWQWHSLANGTLSLMQYWNTENAFECLGRALEKLKLVYEILFIAETHLLIANG